MKEQRPINHILLFVFVLYPTCSILILYCIYVYSILYVQSYIVVPLPYFRQGEYVICFWGWIGWREAVLDRKMPGDI